MSKPPACGSTLRQMVRLAVARHCGSKLWLNSVARACCSTPLLDPTARPTRHSVSSTLIHTTPHRRRPPAAACTWWLQGGSVHSKTPLEGVGYARLKLTEHAETWAGTEGGVYRYTLRGCERGGGVRDSVGGGCWRGVPAQRGSSNLLDNNR